MAITDKGKSVELNGNGKPLAVPGWYQHKETGAVIELFRTPEVGTPMIDAFIQTGFVYAGDTDPRIAEAEKIEAAKSEAEKIIAEAKAEAEKIKAESKVVSETKKK